MDVVSANDGDGDQVPEVNDEIDSDEDHRQLKANRIMANQGQLYNFALIL